MTTTVTPTKQVKKRRVPRGNGNCIETKRGVFLYRVIPEEIIVLLRSKLIADTRRKKVV